MAIIVLWAGDPDDGEAQLRPLREYGNALVDSIEPKPYLAHQTLMDAALPHGNHYYWRSVEFDELTDGVIDTIVDRAGQITSPLSTVPVFHMGGAVARVDADATAFGARDALHNINMVGAWPPDAGDRERHVEWVRGFSDAMAPHASGAYVNFLSDEGAEGVRQAYGKDRWDRLVALKGRCDPDNMFRYNQNIDPEG